MDDQVQTPERAEERDRKAPPSAPSRGVQFETKESPERDGRKPGHDPNEYERK